MSGVERTASNDESFQLIEKNEQKPTKRSASSLMAVAALGLALVGTALLVASSNANENSVSTNSKVTRFDEVLEVGTPVDTTTVVDTDVIPTIDFTETHHPTYAPVEEWDVLPNDPNEAHRSVSFFPHPPIQAGAPSFFLFLFLTSDTHPLIYLQKTQPLFSLP